MGVSSKILLFCLLSVCFWNEAKAECTDTSPEFVACSNTFTQDGKSLQRGEYSKYCALVHVYFDCLKAKNCFTERDKTVALNLVENQTGIRCGSSVFGLNSFLLVLILITAITNYF